MKILLRALVVLLAAAPSLPAAAAVEARLDRTRIAPGETVTLLLQHEGRTSAEPSLAPLNGDFDVLGTSSGTSVSIVNGKMSAQTQVKVTLAPKRSGTLKIPAIEWDGERTQPQQVLVEAGGGSGGSAGTERQHVFMTALVDEPQPYVQAGVVLTVKLYTDQPLYQAGLDLDSSGDLLVRQLGEDQNRRETKDGVPYQVIERRYLLVPQRSGLLRLEGPILSAQVADRNSRSPFDDFFGRSPLSGMMGGTRPLHLRGDAVVLDVQPRPAAASGPYWLPAQSITLDESWQPQDGRLRVGEPLTRQLNLVARGLTAAQLPDLSALLNLPDGLKAYPDQPQLEDRVQDGSLIGTRSQSVALIANRPGRYTLPAVRLKWWDVQEDREREVVLPERTLEFLPAAGAPDAAAATPAPGTAASPPATADEGPALPEPAASRGGSGWAWLSLLLGLLWLGTAVAWWLQARRRRTPPPEPVAAAKPLKAEAQRRAFLEACGRNDPTGARRHLIAWAQAHWPEDPPSGLNALAKRLDDWKVTTLLRALDRACYADSPWSGDPLAAALNDLPHDRSKADADPLPGLYS